MPETKSPLEDIYANAQQSSLRKDGSRDYVHPADVAGRFTRIRRIIFVILIAVYAALPFIEIGGHPAVFLDMPKRQFFLFGLTFNAQDFWMAFFLLSAAGFLLITATAILGRIWCGYACPQTVYLEGVYRRIERLLEGPRNARLKRNQGPWTFDKTWRKATKHLLFILISALIAHVLLSYFVSLPGLLSMMGEAPAAHPSAFAWAFVVTALLYFNFAWFREQLCLIVCPYGRLQSVVTDTDSIVVGYDERRGEPRGKHRSLDTVKDEARGDCIDCRRCIVVCPTGIDIRNGLQLDCIGCANCVDACDEVMDKIGKPRGLVRYDSLAGLEGKRRRFIRPRLFLYALFGLVGIGAATVALRSYSPFEANLLRASTSPYTVEGDEVRNTFVLHVVNKSPDTRTFLVEPATGQGLDIVLPQASFALASQEGKRLPVSVVRTLGQPQGANSAKLTVRSGDKEKRVEGRVLGPRN